MKLNEYQSKELLKSINIPTIEGYIAKTPNDARRIGNRIGFPVVLKIMSPDIVHKSDINGVILNVTENNIKSEFLHLIHHVHKKQPLARIEGIYVQKMAKSGGIECIIGIKTDQQFGKVIMFGFGGIYSEVFKDVSMRVLPVDARDIKEMIDETKISKILNGARGKIYDISSIVDTIMKLSNSNNIMEMDINPLIVYEKGCIAVDVRIEND